jgi:Protein of unknown function (DUF3011)
MYSPIFCKPTHQVVQHPGISVIQGIMSAKKGGQRRLTTMRTFKMAFLCVLLTWCAFAGESRADRTVVCESDDQRYRWCPADTRGGVTLDEQMSDSPCVYNHSWGYDRKGIWADKGCRARFRVGDWTDAETVTCESEDQRYRRCPLNTKGSVSLVEQLSDSPCRYNDTWGYDRSGVWVDRGCRARFRAGGWGGKHTVKCESEDQKYTRCPVSTAGGVTLVEHLSDSPCRYNDTWGFDRKGIWVDRGCRATFSIGHSSSGWQTDDEAVSLCKQAITEKVMRSVGRRAQIQFSVADGTGSGSRTQVNGNAVVASRGKADRIAYSCTVDTRKNRVTESRWKWE